MVSDEIKRSKVEQIKEESAYLRGNILEELSDENPYVSDESYELLKFHGSYQGYDRDTATERKKAGLEKEWEFMLRMKCPGGRLTPEQYLALEKIADSYANGTIKITTRQTFQFHCIVKENLQKHIKAINDLMLSTLGGCGDVVRNVMCSAAPFKDKIHEQLLADTYKIAEFCAPKTKAYEALWINGDGNVVQESSEDEVEPLYGKHYMPRKFKIGLATPDDNSIDALTHDLAIILIYEGETLLGYNLAVGGGLGMTHNKPETYPRLATPIAFVKPNELLEAVEAVVKLQRDHGDRSNRKHARLKYVVEENGIDWTIKTFGEYFKKPFEAPKPVDKYEVKDHMGWHQQADGQWFLGIMVDGGRIADWPHAKFKTALHEIITTYQPNISLTADQNIILYDISEGEKAAIETVLQKHGVKLRHQITDVHRFFLACVALPTCGKALAEAERITMPTVELFEKLMEKYGIKQDRIAIRMTGCPNGCARPYVGDIGIVGRTPDHYALYIGGDFEGTRLNEKIFDRVPFEHITDVFDILFAAYVKDRQSHEEGFGNFAHRVGTANLAKQVETALIGEHKWAKAA